MPTTRAQAVTRVRRVLKDWWRESDTLAASATSTTTSLSAVNGTRWSRGDTIQIDDEVIDVATVADNVITVRRGRLGTTAATHADNSTVYIHSPGSWTDNEIENVLSEAEQYVFPHLTEEFVGSIGGTAKLMLDEADATTGWSALGEVASVAVDTDAQLGSNSLKYAFNYSSTGSGAQRKTFTAKDTRPYSYLNLFVYVGTDAFEDSNKDNRLRKDYAFDVRMGTSATVYRSHRVSTDQITSGWNLLSFAVDDMTDTSTATELSGITRLDLKTYADQSITNDNLKFDAWWMTSYPIVKSGYQYYSNPHNVINVREVKIDGKPEIRFQADQRGFWLDSAVSQEFGAGAEIIVSGQKMPEPMTDADNLDVKREVYEIIDLYAAQKLIEQKLAGRTNFESFSGRKNIADVTSAEIITTQNQLFRRIKDLESKLFLPGRGMQF